MKGFAVMWIETGQFLVDHYPESVLTADFDESGAVHAREADAWTAMNRIANDADKTLAVVPMEAKEAKPLDFIAKIRVHCLAKWGMPETWGIIREVWIEGSLERLDLFEGFTNGDQQHWNKDAWFDNSVSHWGGGLPEAQATIRKICGQEEEE